MGGGEGGGGGGGRIMGRGRNSERGGGIIERGRNWEGWGGGGGKDNGEGKELGRGGGGGRIRGNRGRTSIWEKLNNTLWLFIGPSILFVCLCVFFLCFFIQFVFLREQGSASHTRESVSEPCTHHMAHTARQSHS